MGLKDRIKKLEGRERPEGCPACGNRIILGERQDDGSVVWEDPGPCEECGSLPTRQGQITQIVVEYDPPLAEDGDREASAWP